MNDKFAFGNWNAFFFEAAAAIPIRSKAEGVRRLMVMSVTKQQDDEDIYTGPEIDM